MKIRILTSLASVALAIAAFSPRANAHCQIPCGLYDDQGVINALFLDAATIEKAVVEVPKLMEEPTKNANQIARWITNKESHATNIQNVIGAYFLAQRLKLEEASSDKGAYLDKLTACHEVIVAAMKCKQSVDPAAVENLDEALHALAKAFSLKAG